MLFVHGIRPFLSSEDTERSSVEVLLSLSHEELQLSRDVVDQLHGLSAVGLSPVPLDSSFLLSVELFWLHSSHSGSFTLIYISLDMKSMDY